MKKTELMMLVLSLALLVANCSSTQECECPKVGEESSEEGKTESKPAATAATSEKSDRAGASGSESSTEPTKTTSTTSSGTGSSTATTKPVDSTPPPETGTKEPSRTAAASTAGSEESSGDFPPPKSPIGVKPLNTASSILGSSGAETASTGSGTSSSGTTTGSSTASRTGSESTGSSTTGGSSTDPSTTESGSARDQIRKIDRDSDAVLPPTYTPAKGNQSSNTQPAPTGAGSVSKPAATTNVSATQPASTNTATTNAAATSTAASNSTASNASPTTSNTTTTASTQTAEPTKIAFKCDPYEEETKTTLCRGNSSSLKGDALLEFDSRSLSQLFLGLDIIVKSGEVQVNVPGSQPGKATPEKPFVFLGQVPSDGQKVVVKVKADPNEAKSLDYVVRLIYHGKK